MKSIIKKWWFWGIVFLILLIVAFEVYEYIEQQKTIKTWQKIGEAINEEMEKDTRVAETKTHLDEFSYNYVTDEVEYHPIITLEMYNRIKEGMAQEEVISILGKQENKLDGENTYVLEWGNSYKPVTGGYWIQIVFDKKTSKVTNMSQTGL